ncbi:MAG: hypothetical protein WC971_08340 [Coriobacteriia bacterium]
MKDGVAALALGAAFNPLASAAGSIACAALAGHPRAGRTRVAWGWAVLVLAWLAGDGVRALAFARAGWAFVALWGAAGFALGYALPAGAGVLVGHRVTHGTGWLSAVVVAGTLSVALSTVADPLVSGLRRVAGLG